MSPTAVKSLDRATASALEQMRTPPHSLEAEQSVLGAVMIEGKALSEVADVVTEADFYRADHKLIYRSMIEQDGRNQPIDAVTLAEYLQSRHQLEQAGGLAYLATLARDTPTSANCRSYAKIVREHSIRRQMITAGGSIAEQGFNSRTDLRESLDEAQRLVLALGEDRSNTGPMFLTQAVGPWYDDLTKRENAKDGIIGLRTGLDALDQFTCGMEDGDLWIIAGRPGMGKTNFALTVAAERSIVNKDMGLIFSLEMNSNQLVSRLVSNLGRIDLDRIRRAKLDESQWKSSSNATAAMHDSKLLIDDTPGLSVLEMRARARRVKQKHGLRYIIVDHLQLVRAKAENRTQEITAISRDLKDLAKSLKVPVIALSQLNRGVEQRQNKRPVMSDLRESGSIEQDADVIVFLYREAKYEPSSNIFATNIAEAIVGKQRNGPIDTVLLSYYGANSRFANADFQEAEEYRSSNSTASRGTSSRERGFDPDRAQDDGRVPDR